MPTPAMARPLELARGRPGLGVPCVVQRRPPPPFELARVTPSNDPNTPDLSRCGKASVAFAIVESTDHEIYAPARRIYPRRHRRGSARVLIAATVFLAVLWVAQGDAEAHVHASLTTAPDGMSTLSLSFYHGCGSSLPTTSLKVKLPEGTADVVAQNPAGFSSQVGTTELTWNGGPIPYSQRADFVATMRISGERGETLFLPTVQGCAGGEELWIEKTADPEAPNAAPRVVLTQTVAPVSATTTMPATPSQEGSPGIVSEPGKTTAAPTASSPAGPDPGVPSADTAGAQATTGSFTTAPGTTGPGTTGPRPRVAASSTDSPGGIVFLVVSAVIALGALVIFLRRPKRPSRMSDT